MLTLRRYADTMIGVVFLVIAWFYYKGTFIEKKGFMEAEYGPEFLPRIYVSLFVVLSLCLIISNVRKARREKVVDQEKLIINKNAILRTVGTILLLALYISILKNIGFLIASALYMTAQLCIIAPRNKMKPVRFALFSIFVSVILSYIFVNFFYVKLPAGLLGF